MKLRDPNGRPSRRLFEGPEQPRRASAPRPRVVRLENNVAWRLRAQGREGPAIEDAYYMGPTEEP
jgi:hypothetical protein